MKPKIAIIILIIIALFMIWFMFCLYNSYNVENNNLVNSKIESQQKELKQKIEPLKKLTDKEKKEALIQKAETLESKKRREQIEKMTEEEREALKLELIKKGMSPNKIKN